MNIWKSIATKEQNVRIYSPEIFSLRKHRRRRARRNRCFHRLKNNAHARTSFCFRKLATSCGFLQGACAWIQQDARTSSVVFTFINIFHWKFCRQNYSTGQIKVKWGVTLSVWIVYIYRLAIFSFLSFPSFSVFVCFPSFSSCLKEFHKRSSGHFARSPQTRENLFWQ